MDPYFENLNVLLVDDEQFIRSLVARVLRELGVGEIQVAKNGEEAIEKLSSHTARIDLMLLDLEMPAMNGFQVVQKIRSGEANIDQDLPIIILTGHGQEKAVKAAVGLGIHGFLTKPISKDALAKKIKRAINHGPIDPTVLGG